MPGIERLPEFGREIVADSAGAFSIAQLVFLRAIKTAGACADVDTDLGGVVGEDTVHQATLRDVQCLHVRWWLVGAS
jgi:hypothetical protein